jgi:hypothetical protein
MVDTTNTTDSKQPVSDLSEAGAPDEITPAKIESAREAFRSWQGNNSAALHDGDTGDVIQLWLSLNEAIANASRSPIVAPKAR